MNLFHQLATIARRAPEMNAIEQDGDSIPYAEFARRVAALAFSLRSGFGLARGENVAVWLPNCPAALELMWACWCADLCVVPIHAKLHPREVGYILEHCGAKVCFLKSGATPMPSADASASVRFVDVGSSDYRALLDSSKEWHPAGGAHDPAWIFYTSGTTGRPKGAVLSHANLWEMSWRYFADLEHVWPGDALIHSAPLSHGSGLYSIPHTLCGGLNVLLPESSFAAQHILAAIGSHRRSSLFLVPTALRTLVQHPLAGDTPWQNVKNVSYGGAPAHVPDVIRAMEVIGPRLWQGYGQGETPITITCVSPEWHRRWIEDGDLTRLQSAGYARTGVEVRVVDSNGRVCEPGEVGEIVVRSPVTMMGYLRDPKATATSLRDGWLHTGDLGSLAQDGLLWIQGRGKELIISGGMNIYPREVEEVLMQHPALAECAVVGEPSVEWGEQVCAYYVLNAGAAEPNVAELEKWCMERLARFKKPKRFVSVSSLPKSSLGKVLKNMLVREPSATR